MNMTMDSSTNQPSVSERWNTKNFQEMVQLWNLTADDEINLRKLQYQIQDITHWKNDPFEVVRYYKTYKTLPKTEKMVRQMVQWRIQNDMDTLLQRYNNEETTMNNYPDPSLWLQLPCAILNTWDKDGDPILFDRVGAADSLGLYKEFGADGFADYAVFVRELMCSPSFWEYYSEQQQGRRVKKFNLIVDLEDLHAGPLKPGLIRVLQKVSRILQDYYAGWEKVCNVELTTMGTSASEILEIIQCSLFFV
jgi:CRAL/TRIO domain